jgi:DNA invertase Pin-like site-specific DNA recombinase
MKIGYIRVSTVEQNEARQIELMQKLGIEKVFIDKCSGKDTNRPELKRMFEFMDNFHRFNKDLPEANKQSLVLHIESFSRLARSTQDLLNLVEKIKNYGVTLVSQKESIDTGTAAGKMMLTMFSAIYEFERDCMLERQREGIAIAKKEGKYKGRKKIIYPGNWQEVYPKWKSRSIKGNEAMKELGLKRNTFYTLIEEYEKSLVT